MPIDDRQKHISHDDGAPMPRQAPGPLVKILAAIVGVTVLVAAFFVSLFLLVILLAAGLIFGAYIWWKTRELRRQLRERANNAAPEGEVIDNVEFRETNER